MELKESVLIAGKRNAKVFTVEQTIEDLSPQQQLDWLKSMEEMRLRQENQQVANDLDKNQDE